MAFPLGDLGPCSVTFNSVSLGENLDVTVRITDETAPVHTAAAGTASKDEIFTGRLVEIECSLTQSELTELEDVFPSSTRTVNELMFGSPVGTTMSSLGAHLVLKKVTGGVASADATEWITFFLAAPKSTAEWVFDASTQRVTRAFFRAFPVATVPSGETYSIGDFAAIGYGETS